MNEINGSDLFVFMDGTPIAHATNHSLSHKMAPRGTSNKDSGDFETRGKGRKDVTASCEGLIVYGDIQLLRIAMANRDAVQLDFGEQAGGVLDETKIYATGWFFLTGLDEGAPDAGNATYNASFEHAHGFEYVNEGELSVRVAHSNCTTHEGTQGFAAAFPIGGTPPYFYEWTPGEALDDQWISGQVAGTYTVEVTDSATPTAAVVESSCVITEPAA